MEFLATLFRSLGVKLVAASLAAELLVVGALFFNDRTILSDIVTEQTEQRHAALRHLMNASLSIPLVERDNGALQDTLNAIHAAGGFRYLALTDTTGLTMAAVGWDWTEPPVPSTGRPGSDGQPVWHAALDVRLGGQTYGRLYYGLSTASLIEAQRQMEISALSILALALVISTVLFSLIGYWLTHRLRRVAETAETIAEENLSARVAIDGGGDEIARLGHSFNAMADALEGKMREVSERETDLRRSNDDLKQFAYLASHDLQTPLRTVVSYVQLIERRYADLLDKDGRDYIAFAASAAKRMSALLQDILAYTLLDSRRQEMAEVALDDVWKAVTRALAPAIAKTGAKITQDGPLPVVRGIEDQLAQVLQSLLENALKYRSPQRPLEISLSAERDGPMWRLAMRDNGLGIDPAYLDRIFMIFQRLHTEDKYEGTGIGLALCKKVIEHHGGDIWAVSEGEDRGAAFLFTLPAAAA